MYTPIIPFNVSGAIILRGWLALFVALAFCGCSLSSQEGEDEHSPLPVSFDAPITETRGTPVTKDDQTALTSLGIYAYSTGTSEFDPTTSIPNIGKNLLLTRLGENEWTYSPMMYWPSANIKMSFLAYAPHASVQPDNFKLSEPSIAGAQSIDFAVPDDVSKQFDFLISEPVLNCNRTIGVVPLKLQHALTQITFSASIAPESPYSKEDVKVESIKLTEIKNSGTTTMSTPISWSSLGGTTAYYELSITNGLLQDIGLNKTKKYIQAKNGILLLMPQDFKALSTASIEVTFKWTTPPDVQPPMKQTFLLSDFTMDVTEKWIPGRSINYQISFGADEITLKTELTEWKKQPTFPGGDNNGYLPWG